MIGIDRKVCRDILKTTKDYSVSILFDPALGGYCRWNMRHPEKIDLKSSVPVCEVPGALQRLEKMDLIHKIQGIASGGVIFCITPELLHSKSFWFDRVTKKFLAGFVSGVFVGITANILTPHVIALAVRLFELIRSLL